MPIRRGLPAQPFGLHFRGRLAVIPSHAEGSRCYYAKKGDTVTLEMYATAPVGTEVWLRHEIRYSSTSQDTGRAGWQCLGRVTASVQTERGTRTRLPRYRTTFVLIGDPEKSQY